MGPVEENVVLFFPSLTIAPSGTPHVAILSIYPQTRA